MLRKSHRHRIHFRQQPSKGRQYLGIKISKSPKCRESFALLSKTKAMVVLVAAITGVQGTAWQACFQTEEKKAFGDSGNGKAWHTNGKASCGEEPVEVAFSQLLALEETDRSGEGKQNSKDRQDVKMKLPLLSFICKKKGWNNFTRARFSIDENGDSNKVIRLGQARRKLNLRHLFRIPSKILLFRLKLKLTKFQIKKKATEQFEQEAGDDENEDRELCKKRILMGGRCRPLSSPGYKEMYSNSWTRAQP
ncbi:hypothetical protein ACSQ67_015204 [Phaseolus vulgaris]